MIAFVNEKTHTVYLGKYANVSDQEEYINKVTKLLNRDEYIVPCHVFGKFIYTSIGKVKIGVSNQVTNSGVEMLKLYFTGKNAGTLFPGTSAILCAVNDKYIIIQGYNVTEVNVPKNEHVRSFLTIHLMNNGDGQSVLITNKHVYFFNFGDNESRITIEEWNNIQPPIHSRDWRDWFNESWWDNDNGEPWSTGVLLLGEYTRGGLWSKFTPKENDLPPPMTKIEFETKRREIFTKLVPIELQTLGLTNCLFWLMLNLDRIMKHKSIEGWEESLIKSDIDWTIGRLDDWTIGRLDDWAIGRLVSYAKHNCFNITT